MTETCALCGLSKEKFSRDVLETSQLNLLTLISPLSCYLWFLALCAWPWVQRTQPLISPWSDRLDYIKENFICFAYSS